MGILSRVKAATNHLLSFANARVDSLTAERVEMHRLLELERRGHFDSSAIVLPRCFHQRLYQEILQALPDYEARFESFRSKANNDVDYSYDNSYFSSPDTEILYTMLRQHKPKRVIEIGSGNSTRIMRQAILDGGWQCELISVDPTPRLDVAKIADRVIPERVELARAGVPFDQLRSGDILLIDSSHEVKVGNDVVYLFLKVLPALPVGTLVHVHDIFLPYDYPKGWVIDEHWVMGEQYLLAAMLFGEESWGVLWPGHYLQRTLPNFPALFANRPAGRAQSFWMRKLR